MKKLILVAVLAASSQLAGCASSGTFLFIGVHADVTDKVHGCNRKTDSNCGLAGPREQARISVMYAPGLAIKGGRSVTGYCSWDHDSHYTAGKPFNDKREQSVEAPGCGGVFQFGSRQ
jgi:hypothetical protein